jgi:pimeloyl-ACP methyl ester carboxylesterase
MPSISFFYPAQLPVALPPSIQRQIIPSPSGPLELLVASPADGSLPRKRAIFFAHGGCSGAATWLEWMDYFSQQHNIPCYAVSYRGHGSSWYPSYLRMFFTTKRSMANDLVIGFKASMALEREVTRSEREIVLVGHSAGGGLSQLVLSEGDIRVAGLALIGAIPCFGR